IDRFPFQQAMAPAGVASVLSAGPANLHAADVTSAPLSRLNVDEVDEADRRLMKVPLPDQSLVDLRLQDTSLMVDDRSGIPNLIVKFRGPQPPEHDAHAV